MPYCLKCNDTEWFQYDENHSQVCNACCTHDQGYWQLTKHYGNVGKWCCKNGCGHLVDEPPKHTPKYVFNDKMELVAT